MSQAKFETINTDRLTAVTGGDGGRSFWDRMKNLGKAAVNGVYNVIPDKITGVDIGGKKGGSVQGEWDKRKNLGDTPFKDDPLAKFRGDR